ncbi:D-alanyl-D-alanine carboxypeptidase DacF [bacterium HR40]|nr:D-alanyl-D-alanine carboxypeptidase DacF [bacterium HR40]
MKPYWRLVFAIWILWLPSAGAAYARTEAAIVVEAGNGRVLHERGADLPIYPASLTKMMTLYLLFEAVDRGELKLDDRLPVSARAAAMPASRLGLAAGESIRVEDAIRALVVKSANDVAVVVAEALAGSEQEFAQAMTRRARTLGMSRTTFANASGLPDDRQQTTVRDLATLARHLVLDFPQFYRYFSAPEFRWQGRVHRSHNGILRLYRGADGLKTGYIRASGYNLAASAVRNGKRVIAVYVGGPTAPARDRTVAGLLDLGFAQLEDAGTRVAQATAVRPATPPAAAPAARSASAVGRREQDPAPPRSRPQTPSRTAVADAQPARLSRPPVTPVAANGPLFGVQIGSFLRRDEADRAARALVRRFPDLLDGTIDVSPRKGRRKLFYEARVAGFSEREAQRICRQLERRRHECLVVRYDGPVRVASR